jgi:hypothetical protein
MVNMEKVYQISLEQNGFGGKCFEMTDGVEVARESSIEKCLAYFGLDADEYSVNEWAKIASMNNNC